MEQWNLRFKHTDVASIKATIIRNLEFRLAKDPATATAYDTYLAVAYTVHECLLSNWMLTQQSYDLLKGKTVYFLSMEYLLGRLLQSSMLSLADSQNIHQALDELGLHLPNVIENEVDAALGNGGLGRLAACFLDSLATLGIPAVGYGIRYQFGLFRQRIEREQQVELPDNWLRLPCPWEVARPESIYPIGFRGHTVAHRTPSGAMVSSWLPEEVVLAAPYDIPIPGYDTLTVNTLRLWSAQATEEFSFEDFNTGDYMTASQRKVNTESLTKVLYPNDSFFVGRELRLRQEFFLVAASLQDILQHYKRVHGDLEAFAEHVAIQLNDTHPALAIPELMRLLHDEECLPWERAWAITVATMGYTNHTLLPEALEEWPVSLLGTLLPRHMEIIYRINHEFLDGVAQRYPGEDDRLARMSLIAETPVKSVRMAPLAIVGAHAVNGVAALHSRLLRDNLFRDYAAYWPARFHNITNGVTPRRWLRQANPWLSALITEAIGPGWVKDLSEIVALEALADDTVFQERWRAAKLQAKLALHATVGVPHAHEDTIADTLFDVQVKRFHLYKRQLLFALFMVREYLRAHAGEDVLPRTCIISGKAAPGYAMAKRVIHLINALARYMGSQATPVPLRVVFLADYRVSLAERIIPAAELSEQISTAGMEASGTGNMKMALNGAITIGTYDGANIEICEHVGDDNIFIFGLRADEVLAWRARGYHPQEVLAATPSLVEVLDFLDSGILDPEDRAAFRPLTEELRTQDAFFICADFAAYCAAQDAVACAYRDTARWTGMSIRNVARCGDFSSDRTIQEYAGTIWHVDPVVMPPEELLINGQLHFEIDTDVQPRAQEAEDARDQAA